MPVTRSFLSNVKEMYSCAVEYPDTMSFRNKEFALIVKNKILFSIAIWGAKRLNFMFAIRSEDLDSFRIRVKTCDRVTITLKNSTTFFPRVKAPDVLTIFIT